MTVAYRNRLWNLKLACLDPFIYSSLVVFVLGVASAHLRFVTGWMLGVGWAAIWVAFAWPFLRMRIERDGDEIRIINPYRTLQCSASAVSLVGPRQVFVGNHVPLVFVIGDESDVPIKLMAVPYQDFFALDLGSTSGLTSRDE
jgi:hypothetical protein